MSCLELLAPAGNLNKLKTALHFGADAVYVGGKSFSLRSYAGNFSEEELLEAVSIVHNMGKKLYVTVNIFAKNSDFEELTQYLKFLEKIRADAAIITDPGVIALAREVAPNLPIHLSTQANTLNKYSASFWKKCGVERVVLARELSLSEISEIHSFNENLELEAFVHGAMCISYSGRCLISNYMSKRDANRGECLQACRWHYTLTEKERHSNLPMEIEEDERGSYFMNSKDLNLIEHLKELAQAGVISFKIEGRMKSEIYIATVVNAYRRALDSLNNKDSFDIQIFKDELIKISHREYTTAYLINKNNDTVCYSDEGAKVDYIFIAAVRGYENGYATVEMRNRFKVGQELEILSPSDSFLKTFVVEEIINRQGDSIDDAKLVQEILKVKVPYPVYEGDILRMKISQ